MNTELYCNAQTKQTRACLLFGHINIIIYIYTDSGGIIGCSGGPLFSLYIGLGGPCFDKYAVTQLGVMNILLKGYIHCDLTENRNILKLIKW